MAVLSAEKSKRQVGEKKILVSGRIGANPFSLESKPQLVTLAVFRNTFRNEIKKIHQSNIAQTNQIAGTDRNRQTQNKRKRSRRCKSCNQGDSNPGESAITWTKIIS